MKVVYSDLKFGHFKSQFWMFRFIRYSQVFSSIVWDYIFIHYETFLRFILQANPGQNSVIRLLMDMIKLHVTSSLKKNLLFWQISAELWSHIRCGTKISKCHMLPSLLIGFKGLFNSIIKNDMTNGIIWDLWFIVHFKLGRSQAKEWASLFLCNPQAVIQTCT